MKIPQLVKKSEIKTCHNVSWEDNYSWIHQENILDVLKDSSKLLPEVRKYLEEENAYTEYHLKDTKELQKKLFGEIKGRIKLDDESLPFKDKVYEYWTKTTTKGNYSIKLRKKIGTSKIEEISDFPEELEKKILHIILSHHGEKQYGSPIEPIFPEAVAFHNIDKTDASIQNIKQTIQNDNKDGDWAYDSFQKKVIYKK